MYAVFICIKLNNVYFTLQVISIKDFMDTFETLWCLPLDRNIVRKFDKCRLGFYIAYIIYLAILTQ